MNAPSFKKKIRFSIEVDGDIAKAVQAMAFVSGRTFEDIAIDALEGYDDRHESMPELHKDAGRLVVGGDRAGMVARLKAYRDATRADYPDEIITLNELEDVGEMTLEAARLMRLALRAAREKAA